MATTPSATASDGSSSRCAGRISGQGVACHRLPQPAGIGLLPLRRLAGSATLWGSETRARVLTRADASILVCRVSHPLPSHRCICPSRRPFWTLERPRDHRASPPTPGTSPPSRPSRCQRPRQGAAGSGRRGAPPPTAPKLDRHARDVAALAPKANRQTLDPPAPATPGQTTNSRRAAPTACASRHREPDVGLPTDTR